MKAFLRGLLHFLRGTIHYKLFHKGPGDLSKKAIVIPINSHRFGALPGQRRNPAQKQEPGKIVIHTLAVKTASSN